MWDYSGAPIELDVCDGWFSCMTTLCACLNPCGCFCGILLLSGASDMFSDLGCIVLAFVFDNERKL